MFMRFKKYLILLLMLGLILSLPLTALSAEIPFDSANWTKEEGESFITFNQEGGVDFAVTGAGEYAELGYTRGFGASSDFTVSVDFSNFSADGDHVDPGVKTDGIAGISFGFSWVTDNTGPDHKYAGIGVGLYRVILDGAQSTYAVPVYFDESAISVIDGPFPGYTVHDASGMTSGTFSLVKQGNQASAYLDDLLLGTTTFSNPLSEDYYLFLDASSGIISNGGDVIVNADATTQVTFSNAQTSAPVPPAVWLLGSGLLGLLVMRRRWHI